MVIVNVMAVSLDGRIATRPDEPDRERRALGFTNDDDRQHVETLLADADAVISGAASLAASGGAWEAKNRASGNPPIWVIMTRRGLPASSRFWHQTSLERWVVSPAPVPIPPHAGDVRVIIYADDQPAAAVRAALTAAGVKKTLLFGGSEVSRQFYKEGQVDELCLTVCPIIVGAEQAVPLVAPPLPRPVTLTLQGSHHRGNLVFLNYKVLNR